ncbi:AAA family ATPase [Barrientosiimonas humi]|uniref:AAA family ATPase n=1 Tax=Barrientosiimonas humi TaxID=999931 RepID=UPI00370D9986
MRLHRLRLQAFGPFPGEHEIDFDGLGEAGLHLVHGPTGAGKTSILDAVCFAIFGALPGARAGVAAPASRFARGDVRPEVSLEMTVAGRRLRFVRSPEHERPKKRGEGTLRLRSTVRLEELREGSWSEVSSKVQEVQQHVDTALGLQLAQFAQVVLLPQGQFATFLHAGPDERAAVLRRLFDIQRFEDVERWFAESTSAAREQVAEQTRPLLEARSLVESVLSHLDDDDDDSAGDLSETVVAQHGSRSRERAAAEDAGEVVEREVEDRAEVEEDDGAGATGASLPAVSDPVALRDHVAGLAAELGERATAAEEQSDAARSAFDTAREALTRGEQTRDLRARGERARAALQRLDSDEARATLAADRDELAAAQRALLVVAPLQQVAAAQTRHGEAAAVRDSAVPDFVPRGSAASAASDGDSGDRGAVAGGDPTSSAHDSPASRSAHGSPAAGDDGSPDGTPDDVPAPMSADDWLARLAAASPALHEHVTETRRVAARLRDAVRAAEELAAHRAEAVKQAAATERLRARESSLAAALTSAGDGAALPHAEQLVTACEAAQHRFDQLTERQRAARTSGEQLTARFDQHRDAKAAQDALQATWRGQVTARLALDLRDDEPCPVCGSLAHPDPAHGSDPELVSDAQLDAAAEAAEHARVAEVEASRVAERAAERVEGGESELAAALSAVADLARGEGSPEAGTVSPPPQVRAVDLTEVAGWLTQVDRSARDWRRRCTAARDEHERLELELASLREELGDHADAARQSELDRVAARARLRETAADVAAGSARARSARVEHDRRCACGGEPEVVAAEAGAACWPLDDADELLALLGDVGVGAADPPEASGEGAGAAGEGAGAAQSSAVAVQGTFDAFLLDGGQPSDVSFDPTAATEGRAAADSLDAAATALGEAHRRRHDAVRDWSRAEREEAEAARALTAARDRLAAALTEAQLADPAAARAAQRDPRRIKELTRTTREREDARRDAARVLDDAEVARSLEADPPDVAALAQRVTQQQGRWTQTQRRAAQLERDARTVRSAGARIATAGEALAPLVERRDRLERLSAVVSGARGSEAELRMRLSAYVLAARLEHIVRLANDRLATMTSGRFRLVHDVSNGARNTRGGLGLKVDDAWTGEQRATASLSGGETFLASLALALALGDAIQHDAGGRPLQTLFVDEGFGSLDDESLDHVLDVLDQLREGGRTVGIVSHLAELRQRIPAQIEVRKSESGSSLHVQLPTDAAVPA